MEGHVPKSTLALRASFGFGSLFAETEMSHESACPVAASKCLLHIPSQHFDHFNQLCYVPSSSNYSKNSCRTPPEGNISTALVERRKGQIFFLLEQAHYFSASNYSMNFSFVCPRGILRMIAVWWTDLPLLPPLGQTERVN